MSWQQGQGTSSGNGRSWSPSEHCLETRLFACRSRPRTWRARDAQTQTQAHGELGMHRPRTWRARDAHSRSRSREHSRRPGPDAYFERACQPNLDEDSKTGAKAYPPQMQWKYHWDRDHDRWHSKGIRVGPPGGGRNAPPGLHTRRNKVMKENKKRKTHERAVEDLLDPAGEAGRQAARDEERRRNHMRCAARRNLD
jgi:hypothetical protein